MSIPHSAAQEFQQCVEILHDAIDRCKMASNHGWEDHSIVCVASKAVFYGFLKWFHLTQMPLSFEMPPDTFEFEGTIVLRVNEPGYWAAARNYARPPA